MELWRAFDCIPRDFLIAKLHGYVFSIDPIKLFYSYLKRRKQNVRISNTHSVYQILHLRFLDFQYLGHYHSTYRSNHPELFLEKGILNICSKFTSEQPCRSVISIKLQSNVIEITLRHRKFAAYFQNTFY